MRFRMGPALAAIALVVISACSSSGGTKPVVQKTGAEWFQARPLIMPGFHATTVRSDPFGSLHLPASEDAYQRLSPAQRGELANALRSVDCAHPPQLTASADRVVCDSYSDAFLLGAPLLTGNDVIRAKPLPPSASIVDWQMSLSLTSTAAGKIHRWSSLHHVLAQSGAFNDVQTSAQPPCGPALSTRCADFTAYISNNLVVTIPVWSAPADKTVIIAGLTQASATGIARKLTD